VKYVAVAQQHTKTRKEKRSNTATYKTRKEERRKEDFPAAFFIIIE